MKNLPAGDIPYTTRTEWRQKATQFLLYMEYLQPGDMLWNGKVTLNICMRIFFLDFIATFATRILTHWYTMV